MRFIFRVLGILVALVVVAVAALFFVPSDRIGAVVAERFKAATGRDMAITGDIRPQLWPDLGVRVEGVEIANSDWSDKGPMLTAERLNVAVDWSALLGGEVQVTGAEVVSPAILLEAGPDGTGNWTFDTGGTEAAAASSGESAGAPAGFALDLATITNGSLRFIDTGGVERAFTDVNADIRLPASAPVTLTADALANGTPVQISLETAELEAVLSGAPAPLSAKISADGSTVTFNGTASTAPNVTGALDVALGSDALFLAAGLGAMDLPVGLGADSIGVTGQLSATAENVALSGANITLDQNSLAGDIAVDLTGVRPFVTAALTSPGLDLSALGGDEGESEGDGSADAESPEGWSTEPIDASALGLVDGEFSLVTSSFLLGTSQFGSTNISATLDNSRLVANLNELRAYDGEVQGGFVVNNRSGLSASTNLSGSAIAISRLFSELFEYDRLIALGDMQISVLAVGQSMDALLNSMDGEGRFSFGAGEILGFDLAGALKQLDVSALRSGTSTIFESISGTFRIVEGVVINDDLNFLAPLLTARGTGSIGLGGQTLDYRLVPKLLQGDDGGGIEVPLLITGSWAAPKFRLDLQGMVEDRAEEELQKVGDRLSDEVQDEVNQELGLTEGQSVEDAVKDKLEEEAGNLLRGLLGGN